MRESWLAHECLPETACTPLHLLIELEKWEHVCLASLIAGGRSLPSTAEKKHQQAEAVAFYYTA